jgi:hypothetical protein
MGRHKLNTEQLANKKTELISLFKNHSTMQELADSLNVSRQCIQERFLRYNILNDWREHVTKIRKIISNKIGNESGVYCLFFIQEPNKKYYGSSVNLHKRLTGHNSRLKSNNHENIWLQEKFNKYGWNSLRFEVIKKLDIKYILVEEKNMIKNDPDCINNYLPFQTIDEYNIQRKTANKKKYDLCKNKPYIKSKFYGVTYDKLTEQWRTQPYDKNLKRQVYLGYFKTEEEANNAIIEYKKNK